MAVGNFYNAANGAMTDYGQDYLDSYNTLMGTPSGDVVGLAINNADFGFKAGKFDAIVAASKKPSDSVGTIVQRS